MKLSNERSDPGPRRMLIDETEADACTDLSGLIDDDVLQ